jgi:hypothetical protein
MPIALGTWAGGDVRLTVGRARGDVFRAGAGFVARGLRAPALSVAARGLGELRPAVRRFAA